MTTCTVKKYHGVFFIPFGGDLVIIEYPFCAHACASMADYCSNTNSYASDDPNHHVKYDVTAEFFDSCMVIMMTSVDMNIFHHRRYPLSRTDTLSHSDL